jgi:hypothetical protein
MEAALSSPFPPPRPAQSSFHYILRLRLAGDAPGVTVGLDAEELAFYYEPDQIAALLAGQPLLSGGVVHVHTEAFISARLAEAMLHLDARNEQQAPDPAFDPNLRPAALAGLLP